MQSAGLMNYVSQLLEAQKPAISFTDAEMNAVVSWQRTKATPHEHNARSQQYQKLDPLSNRK
jgi:hypothetical protein